uniref:Uncharacterized protein n=1 Tax=Rhipicephalus microplus TaxID=6941 RepID=A0A6G5AGM1_RHIMP
MYRMIAWQTQTTDPNMKIMTCASCNNMTTCHAHDALAAVSLASLIPNLVLRYVNTRRRYVTGANMVITRCVSCNNMTTCNAHDALVTVSPAFLILNLILRDANG